VKPFYPERKVSVRESEDTINRYIDYWKNKKSKTELIQDVETLREEFGLERSKEAIPFPYIMDGAAGHFADVYGSYLEVPKHFLYMSYLTCLGSILADRLTVLTELNPQPRLYTILLGESADDRKSTALIKVVNFFKESLTDFNVCWGVGSAEGLQRRLKTDNNLLLCFDELKQFVNKCKIETSVLLPCVNTLFEANFFESNTKTTQVNIDNGKLTFLAASTIQTYEKIWTQAFTDIGFTNRLFLVPGTGTKRFSIPLKVPQDKKFELAKDLKTLLENVGDRLELDLSTDAKEVYHDWYMNIPDSIHSKRLDTYALRLMALVAVNEFKQKIDAPIVSKTVRLSDWQLEVRTLYDPIDAETSIGKIEEKIRRQLAKGSLNDRDLKLAVHAHRSGLWIYNSAIKNLSRFGEIKFDKKTKSWELIE